MINKKKEKKRKKNVHVKLFVVKIDETISMVIIAQVYEVFQVLNVSKSKGTRETCVYHILTCYEK